MKWLFPQFKTGVLAIALGAYLTMAFLGLSLAQREMAMVHCPFMAAEKTACPMTFSDHINAWQTTIASTAVECISIAMLIAICALFISILFSFPLPSRTELLYIRQRYRDPIIPLGTRLFSSGILHSRAF